MHHIYIPHPNEWKLKIEGENKQKKIRYEINPEEKKKRRKTTPWESHQIIAGPGETEHHPQTFHFQTVSLLL